MGKKQRNQTRKKARPGRPYDAFFILLFCIGAAFLSFTKTHYSSDSYSAVNVMGSTMHLANGRPVAYLIQGALDRVHINLVRGQQVATVLFICVLAFSAYMLYREICKYVDGEDKLRRALAMAGLLCAYINVFFAEWFFFVEVLSIFAAAILLATAAAVAASRGPDVRTGAVAVVLLTAALCTYQVVVTLFVTMALVIVFAKHGGSLNRSSVLHSVLIVAEGGSASVLSVLISELIGMQVGISSSGRGITLAPEDLLNNWREIWASQGFIFTRADGFLPKWTPIGFLVAFAALFLYVLLSQGKKQKAGTALYCGLILLACYGLTFGVHLISEAIWLSPRTVVGVFWLFTVLIVGIAVLISPKKDIGYVAAALAAAFLVLNAYHIWGIAKNNRDSNEIDRYYALQIQAGIEAYEAETGLEVKKIAAVNDGIPTYRYPGISYSAYDMNRRDLAVEWARVDLINLYCGTSYQMISMPEEIYEEYFYGRNWDTFDFAQQAVFDGDTLYMAMY